jgi:hypothetical protein
VEVGGWGAVALDELRRGSLGVGGDLPLVRRQRELGIAEPRREMVERRSGMPGDRSEQLVAAPELGKRVVVAVEEQQAAPRELSDPARVCDLRPLGVRDPEEQRQRLLLDRTCLSGQDRRDERRIARAVDEEERRSAGAGQR